MNVSVEHKDKVEMEQTHIFLLTKDE